MPGGNAPNSSNGEAAGCDHRCARMRATTGRGGARIFSAFASELMRAGAVGRLVESRGGSGPVLSRAKCGPQRQLAHRATLGGPAARRRKDSAMREKTPRPCNFPITKPCRALMLGPARARHPPSG